MSTLEHEAQVPIILEHNYSVIQQIMACIENGRYCTLLGPRFTGKTAVLRHVQQTAADDPTLVCVYVSLDEVETGTLTAFFNGLAHIIAQRVADQTDLGLPMPVEEVTGSFRFRDFLHDSTAWLKRDLVLLIDHLEAVPTDLLRALLSALRALAMEQTTDWLPTRRRLVAIVAGAMSLAMLTVGESSPFGNIATPLYIGDLTESQSKALIAAQTMSDHVAVSQAVRDRLLQAAGGNAHLIRLICRRCLQEAHDHGSQRLTTRRLNKSIHKFLQDEAAHYQPLQEAIRMIEEDTDLLRCIILLLERNVLPTRDLPLPLLPDLDPLYLTGMVKKTPKNRYQFRNEIYQRFLGRYFDSDRVGHLLIMAGRWESAIDYLEVSINAGNDSNRSYLLESTINAMYAADDIKTAVYFMARALTVIFGVQEARIWLISNDKQRLTLVQQLELTTAAASPPRQEIFIKEDRLEAHAYREEYTLRAQEGNRMRRAVPLCVPGHTPVGILTIDADQDGEELGQQPERELQLMSYLSQAASALQAVNTRREQAETLRDISTVIGATLRLDKVLNRILEQMARVLPFDMASIQLLSSNRAALQVITSVGFQDPAGVETVTFPLEDRFPNVRVWRGKMPRRYGNIQDSFPHFAHPEYQAGQVRGWMGIPLIANDEAIGVLTFDSFAPDIYTQEHEDLAMLIANQAALAIQRAQLYDREVQDKELMRAIKDLFQAIAQKAGSAQDLGQIWRLILDGAMRLTGAEAGNISLVDEARGIVSNLISVGFPDDPATEHAIGAQSIQGWVAANKRPALVLNVKTEIPWKNIYYAGRPDTLAELAVPILRGDSEELVGIINLESPRESAFDKDDLHLLEDLAVHADLAVHNVQQYKALEEGQLRLHGLHQASNAISQAGLEIDTVLQAILDQAVAVTEASIGALQMVDRDDLIIKAAWPPQRLELLRQKIGRIPIAGPGITARAVRKNDAQLVPDVRLDSDFIAVTGDTGSELAVALRDEGQPIGVLNVEHPQAYGLDENDRDLLIGLANLAVVAWRNAKRYEELEKAKDNLLASEAVAWLGLFGADWQHSINQKIFSVMNYANGLQRWLTEHQVSPDIAEGVCQGLDRITKVVESIRSVKFTSQVPATMPGESDGLTIIDDELKEIVNRWCSGRTDVTTILQLDCRGVAVKILPQWLGVAMEKLINNALKAMPEGGRLSITTQPLPDIVNIIVKDTGHGIPAHARPYFLKRTVPRRSGEAGSGMGALIARFVALSHGGDLILVDTRPGQGTELLLTLPVAQDAHSRSVVRGGQEP